MLMAGGQLDLQRPEGSVVMQLSNKGVNAGKGMQEVRKPSNVRSVYLPVVRGQVPVAGQFFGILLALIGIVLASGPELSGASSARPVILAIGSAVGFGISLACIAGGSGSNVVMTMTTMRLTSVVVALGAVVVARSVGGITTRDVPMLALTGWFDVLANILFGVASGLALLPVVAVLGSLYPVATIVLAWRLHHERLAAVQYAGIAVALSGVALIGGFSAA